MGWRARRVSQSKRITSLCPPMPPGSTTTGEGLTVQVSRLRQLTFLVLRYIDVINEAWCSKHKRAFTILMHFFFMKSNSAFYFCALVFIR